MSRETVLNSLRFAADKSYSVVDQYFGLHRSAVSIVTITNSTVDIFGEGGTKTRTDLRITLGDGYIADIPWDGYINCSLKQVSAKDIFLSGGLLTDRDYVLGPIVFPYTSCGHSGGIDLTLFNPAYETDNNIQLYFKIVDDSFPNGAYFKRIWSVEDSGISYKIYLRNTGVQNLDIS